MLLNLLELTDTYSDELVLSAYFIYGSALVTFAATNKLCLPGIYVHC